VDDFALFVLPAADDLAIVLLAAGCTAGEEVTEVAAGVVGGVLAPVDCAAASEPSKGAKMRRANRWSLRRQDGGFCMVTCFLGDAAGQGRGF